ncbi:MAG: hypothetical protein ACRYFU_01405, partial [Janthinobacterium lividum]
DRPFRCGAIFFKDLDAMLGSGLFWTWRSIPSPENLVLIVHDKHDDQTIVLDGKHFIDCTLENCLLAYVGDEVMLKRTQIIRCRCLFSRHVRMTIEPLQAVVLVPATFIDNLGAGLLIHSIGRLGYYG